MLTSRAARSAAGLAGLALAVGASGWALAAEQPQGKQRKPRVVVLGSGWGAVSVVSNLPPGQFDVTVVSPRNHFLFTPLSRWAR